MGEYWNTAVTVRMVIDACEDEGVDTAAILASAGIDRSVTEDPEGRVSLEQMSRFWREAVAQSGDPAIGLHAGLRAPHGIYGLFDYIYGYSPTIGAALDRFGVYLPLINNWILTRTEVDEEFGRLVLGVVWGAMPRTSAEYVTAVLVERGKKQWAVDWAPALIRYEFAQPGPAEAAAEHERLLGCEVEYDAAATEIILTRETWDTPVHNADAGLVEMLERQADEIIGQLPTATTLVDDVRREVRSAMAGGDQGVDVVAERLGMSARTLQRRLSSDGLSFASIVDEVRLETAKLALADLSLSLAEVSFYVGFEEQSSFSRAFKRWTGMSPRQYRVGLTPGSQTDWPDTVTSGKDLHR